MVRTSGQHKCALIFCGVLFLILGGGITASGFIYDFLDPYDNISTVKTDYFPHVQYWLGIPLFILGIYVLITWFCRARCLFIFGLVIASLLLVISICAAMLQGSSWREWLQKALFVNENDCKDVGERCSCTDSSSFPLSCDKIKYAAVMHSIMAVFSALAIAISLFCSFVYVRILGCMLHIRYEDPIDDYYAKAAGSHFINGQHGRGIGGHARANQVALNTFNQ